MNTIKTVASITLILAGISLWARPAENSVKTPKDLVKEFWQIETQGGRLTSDGWIKASHFFIRPLPPPALYAIHVIPNGSVGTIDESARTNNWAELWVGTIELGTLDSALHFKRSPERVPNGPLIGPTLIKFDLVLTDKHWELKPDGILGPEISGPPEWKIVSESGNGLWVSVDAAVRYVDAEREKATDPVIRKNAKGSLAELKELQSIAFHRSQN